MTELTHEARAVLDAGRRAMSPTAADRARVRRALDARLAAPPARPVVRLPRGVSLGLGLGALVLVAVALWWWAAHPSPPPAAPLPSPSSAAPEVRPVGPAPVAPVIAPVVPVVPSAVAPPVVAPVVPTPRARTTPVVSDEDTLAEEMRLLGVARRAQAASRDTEALGALAEHRRRFPRGSLTEEREATELLVRCGRQEPGLAGRIAAFARRFPQSPQQPRVDRVCAGATGE